MNRPLAVSLLVATKLISANQTQMSAEKVEIAIGAKFSQATFAAIAAINACWNSAGQTRHRHSNRSMSTQKYLLQGWTLDIYLKGKAIVQVQCDSINRCWRGVVDGPMPQESVDPICQVDRDLHLTSAMHCQIVFIVIDCTRIVVVEWQSGHIVLLKHS